MSLPSTSEEVDDFFESLTDFLDIIDDPLHSDIRDEILLDDKESSEILSRISQKLEDLGIDTTLDDEKIEDNLEALLPELKELLAHDLNIVNSRDILNLREKKMPGTKTLNGWITDELTGVEKHYLNGVLHANVGPAERRPNGTQGYYQHGRLHRDGDEPAFMTAGGSVKYAKNNKYHRDGGLPAIIWSGGGGPGKLYRQEYWVNGEVVRAIKTDDTEVWFAPNCTKIGSAVLSRKDGPAVIYPDRSSEYWLNGTKFSTKAAWDKAVSLEALRLENEKLINSKIDSEDEHSDIVEAEPTKIKAKGTKKMNKPSVTDTLKSNMVEAGYRVGATQATKAVKMAVVNVMKNKGADNGAISGVSSFLETEFGTAVIGLMLGLGLQHVPHFSDDARVQKLAEEMRVNGMATAGNAVIGEALEQLLPALTSVLNNLPALEESNVTRIKEERGSLASAVEEEEPVKVKTVRSMNA